MNKDDKSLLTALYKNVKMGVQSIEELLPLIKCENLAILLTDQLAKYEVFSRECEMIASADKIDIKDNNWLDKTMLSGSIKMKTMMNKSTQNITEMLIIGSLMGIIDIIKEKSKAIKASKDILEICKKLEDFQEANLDDLKPFLETIDEDNKN